MGGCGGRKKQLLDEREVAGACEGEAKCRRGRVNVWVEVSITIELAQGKKARSSNLVKGKPVSQVRAGSSVCVRASSKRNKQLDGEGDRRKPLGRRKG